MRNDCIAENTTAIEMSALHGYRFFQRGDPSTGEELTPNAITKPDPMDIIKRFVEAREDAKMIGIYYIFIAIGLRFFWMLMLLGAPPGQTLNPPGAASLARFSFYAEMPGNLLARLIMFGAPDLWWLLYPFVLLLNYTLLVLFLDWLLSERK